MSQAAVAAVLLLLACATCCHGQVVTFKTDAAGTAYFNLQKCTAPDGPFFPRGAVISKVSNTISPVGAVVSQTPAATTLMYQRMARYGVTATRDYDAVADGAASLNLAQQNGMMLLTGIRLPALETAAGFSLYASPAWAANQAAWLATSGINATILALKSSPSLLAWTVGNEISLGAASGLRASVNAAGVTQYSGTYTAGWANMWGLVNTIVGYIHALDGNHPARGGPEELS